MNVLVIGDSLDRCGLDIAAELVDRARLEFLRPPSVAQLHDVAKQIRTEEAPSPAPMLPPGDVLPEMPPEVREKVIAMQEKWAQIDEDEEADADAEWQRIKAAHARLPRMAGVCDGAGKAPVNIDGKLSCPDCGVEVPDQIVRIPRREATA